MRLASRLLALSLALAISPSPARAQDGPLRQWAQSAVGVSSNRVGVAFTPQVVAGPPDVDGCTDVEQMNRAWAPLSTDSAEEWIEMRFAAAVYVTGIAVHESLNPGAVAAVSLYDENGALHEIWRGTDTTTTCPGIFRLEIPSRTYRASVVHVELAPDRVPGYNHIDAIELTGIDAAFTQARFVTTDTPEVGAGFFALSLADIDHDGWPDVIGVQAVDPAAERYQDRFAHRWYHNEGNGRFSDRSARLPVPRGVANAGAAMGDYDSDGDLDLFLARGSITQSVALPDLLLRNDGGRFTDVTAAAGLPEAAEISAASLWFDADLDGHLDLLVFHGDYGGVNRVSNALYRNRGDGTFEEVTAAAGLDAPLNDAESKYLAGSFGGGVAADFDDDGWPDLLVGVDSGPNRLYRNEGGRFVDITGGDMASDVSPTGMVAVGDMDGDLDLDILQLALWNDVSTSGRDWRSMLLSNLGSGRFIDVTDAVGLRAADNSALPQLADLDDDGDLDIIIDLPSQLYENDGTGVFLDRAFSSGLSGVFTTIGDIDGDGDLDAWSGGRLFLNEGTGGHSLVVHLVGTSSNRNGIGARLIATAGGLRQRADIQSGNGWIQNAPVARFGLGNHDAVDELEIRWPSDQVDHITDIPVNQEIRVIEGRGEWYPVPRSVWTVDPPAELVPGDSVHFVAECRPTLFEPSAAITAIRGDLSAIGGPAAVPLVEVGDGVYRLEARFVVTRVDAQADVEVLIEQSTTLGPYWINLSRSIHLGDDAASAVVERRDAAVPDVLALLPNYPNPFNPQTTIRFQVPRAGDVTLSVFDIAGQRVITLVTGWREAGTYSLQWDGRDAAGRQLASGTYLYRLRADGQVRTRKLLLVR